MGSTGLSTGPHLHFEVTKGGKVNPMINLINKGIDWLTLPIKKFFKNVIKSSAVQTEAVIASSLSESETREWLTSMNIDLGTLNPGQNADSQYGFGLVGTEASGARHNYVIEDLDGVPTFMMDMHGGQELPELPELQ